VHGKTDFFRPPRDRKQVVMRGRRRIEQRII